MATSWYKSYSIYDLFYKGEYIPFDKLTSHFHIAQKKLSLNMYKSDTMLEIVASPLEILGEVFPLQCRNPKVIYKFYSILYEHRKNKLTGLKKSWSKNIGSEIDAVSWENIIKLSATNRFREIQLNVVHKACISPYKYSKLNKQLSPNCIKCKDSLHTLFHCLCIGM